MKIEDFFEIVDPFMRLQHSYNKSKKHSMQMSVVRKCNTKISEKCNLLFPFYSPFSKRIVYSPQNLQTYNSFTVVWRLYLFVKLWQEILPQRVSSVSSRVQNTSFQLVFCTLEFWEFEYFILVEPLEMPFDWSLLISLRLRNAYYVSNDNRTEIMRWLEWWL